MPPHCGCSFNTVQYIDFINRPRFAFCIHQARLALAAEEEHFISTIQPTNQGQPQRQQQRHPASLPSSKVHSPLSLTLQFTAPMQPCYGGKRTVPNWMIVEGKNVSRRRMRRFLVRQKGWESPFPSFAVRIWLRQRDNVGVRNDLQLKALRLAANVCRHFESPCPLHVFHRFRLGGR